MTHFLDDVARPLVYVVVLLAASGVLGGLGWTSSAVWQREVASTHEDRAKNGSRGNVPPGSERSAWFRVAQ